MTIEKKDDADFKASGYEEPEIVASAVPIKYESNESPIPAGHSRFYCSKCHTVRLVRII